MLVIDRCRLKFLAKEVWPFPQLFLVKITDIALQSYAGLKTAHAGQCEPQPLIREVRRAKPNG